MKIKDLAKILNGEVLGTEELEIIGVSPPDENTEGYISVLFEKKYENRNYFAVLTSKEFLKNINFKSAIVVEKPREKMLELLSLFEEKEEKREKIHETAIISRGAEIESGVYIGPYCIIENNVKIKKGVKLLAFVYVGKNSFIDEDTLIFPFVSIEKNVKIGKRCIIHSGTVIGSDGFGYEKRDGKVVKIPQIGWVNIKDDVEIGANVCIDRAVIGETTLENEVKIDNLVQIAHNVKIGERTLIASQTGIAGSSKIGKDCLIAGQVGIKDHVRVGDRVILTAQTGVSKDVPEGKIYSGYFARDHSIVLKAMNILYELPFYWEKIKKLLKNNIKS
ncbi:MAG: UDP-3-O-(3-hydroxymyristoyl)glucosamine N-acyltransferase [Candidatus Hydrothermales bacterium]